MEPKCERCNDSGLIAVRNHYPMTYVCPGPVPEDARNVTEAFCDCETGEVMGRKYRKRVAGDELSRVCVDIASTSIEQAQELRKSGYRPAYKMRGRQ